MKRSAVMYAVAEGRDLAIRIGEHLWRGDIDRAREGLHCAQMLLGALGRNLDADGAKGPENKPRGRIRLVEGPK